MKEKTIFEYKLLSDFIKKEIKKEKGFESNAIKNYLLSLFYPLTLFKAFIIFLTTCVSSWLSHYIYYPFFTQDWIDLFNSILLDVFKGIAAIVFALVIYIAGCIKDSPDSDTAKVYLHVSKINYLILLQMTGYMTFILKAVVGIQLFIVLSSIILILISFIDVIYMHIYKERLNDQIQNFFILKLTKFYNEIISKRLLEGYLLNHFNHKSGGVQIEYMPLQVDKKSFLHFSSFNMGIVSDINLNELFNIHKIISHAILVRNSNVPTGNFPSEINNSNVIVNIQVLKTLNSEINLNDSNLIRISRSVEKYIEPKEIEKKIQRIFQISKKKKFTENLEDDFKEREDRFIKAIENRNNKTINEFVNFYSNVIDAFIDEIKKYGGYDYSTAISERKNIFEQWDIIKWLNKTIERLYQYIDKIDDREIQKNIMLMPVKFALRGLSNKDHYIFQVFIAYTLKPYFYICEKNEDRYEFDKFSKELSKSLIRGIINYNIIPRIETDITKIDKVQNYLNFIWPVYECYMHLLKKSFEEKDFAYFEEVFKDFLKLYQYTSFMKDYIVYDELYDKNRSQIDDIDKELSTLFKERVIIIFGVASWILSRIENTNDEYFQLLICNLNINPYKLLYIYSFVDVHEGKWKWWTWDIVQDGEVHAVDESSRHIKLLCYLLLKFNKSFNTDNITIENLLKLKESLKGQMANIGELAREQLPKTVDLLINDDNRQKYFPDHINYPTEETIQKLKDFFQSIFNLYQSNIEENIRSSSLNQNKISEFKNTVVEAYNSHSFLKKIYIDFNKYDDRSSDLNYLGKNNPSGINSLFNKEIFIDEPSAITMGLSRFGELMASYEEHGILIKLNHNLNLFNINSDAKEINDTLASITNLLIVHTIIKRSAFERTIRSLGLIYSYSYEKESFSDFMIYDGIVNFKDKKATVLRIFVNDVRLADTIYFVDYKNFGKFIQLPPFSNPDNQSNVHDIFLVKITDLNNDNNWRSRLVNDPNYLPKYQNKTEEKDKFLREQCVIEIYQNFIIELPEEMKGFKIKVNVDENDKDTSFEDDID